MIPKPRLMFLVATIATLVALLSLAIVPTGPVAQADQQGRRIISQKVGTDGVSFQISNQDGSSIVQAGHVEGQPPGWARWSPNDTKIAWSIGSYWGGGLDVYVSDANGTSSSMQNLTNTAGVNELIPMWQPGTDKIVYILEGGSDKSLRIMNSDGSNNQLLLELPSVDIYNFAFSSDGNKIAFSSGFGVDSKVYIADGDGSGLTQIADGAEPVFSPDGTKLVVKYSPTPDPSETVVRVIDLEGNVQADLSDVPEMAGIPTSILWSPDGLTLFYSSPIDPLRRNIFSTVISSKATTQLTNRDASNYPMFFSPDGTKIYFNTTDTPTFEYAVYTVSLSGDVEQLMYEAGYGIIADEAALEPEGSNNSGGGDSNSNGGGTGGDNSSGGSSSGQQNGSVPGVPRTGAALGLGLILVALIAFGLLTAQQVESKHLGKEHEKNKFH